MRRPFRPLRNLLASLLLVAGSCSSPERDAPPPAPPAGSGGSAAPTPAEKPSPAEEPAAAAKPAAQPPGGGTAPQGGPPGEMTAEKAPGKVPPAIRELQEKIQPGGPPPPPPDEKQLIAGAREIAASFVEACRAGDADAARKLVFAPEDFAAALTPGTRDILEANVTAQNSAIIDRLVPALRGKSVEHELHPGGLVIGGASGTFKASPPILSDSTLDITVNGTPLEIRFDQLIYTGGRWKIFRMTAP